MERINRIYNKFSEYMENDTKGVEIGIYTISGIVFAYAYHRIRPITRFVKPTDIPKHFIREKTYQNGIIKYVEPVIGNPILKIKHKPPINLYFSSKKLLPVKIAGIDITGNGYSWLQTCVINKNIKFIPLSITNDFAECQVTVIDASKYNKHLDLADALLSLGFAKTSLSVPELLKEDKIYQHYLKTLKSTEKRAKRKRTGLWMFNTDPPIWPVNFLNKTFSNLINSALPAQKKLPQLAR